jgi:hypothetical protein
MLFLGAGLMLWLSELEAANTLTWSTSQNRVSADLQGVALPRLLQGVAQLTGWTVLVEPGTVHEVSTKFKDCPPGDALHRLLGDLNFALLPQTNHRPCLVVFRTAQAKATLVIAPSDLNATNAAPACAIANELVVRLKPGASIDELARKLGAKVLGKIDSLNAYRLGFGDADAASAAREQLSGNPEVVGVESNYVVAPPPAPQPLVNSPNLPSPVQLKLSPPNGSGKIIVGLVDTAWQPQGNALDAFMLKTLSVAGSASPDPTVPTHATSMYQDILRALSAEPGGASGVQVVSVDVYGSNPTANTFDVALGIVKAVGSGANVINLSLGSPGESAVLHDIIQQVKQSGIPMFAAAGNDASPQPFYPAAYPETISVTASSQGQLASYANYGSFINLIAPGSGVVYFGGSAYLVSGTSTSAAFMSGRTAALADANHLTAAAAAGQQLNSPSLKFIPPPAR